jgi:mRNA interferase RelE/StbE
VVEYEIRFARSARKGLQALDRSLAFRILARIEALSMTPRPSGCAKLEGSNNLWRIRVGDYRVIYEVDDRRRIVDVSAVRHRRDAYR